MEPIDDGNGGQQMEGRILLEIPADSRRNSDKKSEGHTIEQEAQRSHDPKIGKANGRG